MDRETLHRGALLAGVAFLLAAAVLPIVGHHVALDAPDPLPQAQHLGRLCLAALAELLGQVHHGFHIVLAAGLLYAVYDRLSAIRSLRRVLSEVETARLVSGEPLWNAAMSAGVPPGRVRRVTGLPNPVFTAGMFSPTIYVASSLAALLPASELQLVLAHEAAHVARKDPLRLSIYRFLSCCLFWLPALRSLSDDIADEAEIRADDAAATREPLVLASAILRLAESHAAGVPATVGFSRGDLVERRVRRLAGEATSFPTRLTRKSILAAFLGIALVTLSGFAAQAPDGPSHCRHQHMMPFGHILCAGTSWQRAESHCAHSVTRGSAQSLQS